MRRLRVGLGARGYEIFIGRGILEKAGKLVGQVLKRKRVAVVTDEIVARLHGETLVRALADWEVEAPMIVLPPGEQTKDFAHLESLCDQLLELKLDRADRIVALGGGVMGDLTGFAASIYKRGIGFIQVPTTLLAQVDSSVGGKTAIDTPRGKNLIGAFHQPRLVLVDIDVLATLPDREMRSGYAEVLKYGLIGDEEFFRWLEKRGKNVLARDPAALMHAVERSIETKISFVAADERETSGQRALLNLGHTFAHALEAETGYGDTLNHGEAVALGCVLAFRYSASEGVCSQADADRVQAAVAAAGLPSTLKECPGGPFSAVKLIGHMVQDKKSEGGRITLILARRIGEAYVAKGVDSTVVREFLEREGALP